MIDALLITYEVVVRNFEDVNDVLIDINIVCIGSYEIIKSKQAI